MLRSLIQEVRELGAQGTAFRLGWELKVRSGVAEHLARPPLRLDSLPARDASKAARWPEALWFPSPSAVAGAMERLASDAEDQQLLAAARQACAGRIVCFGRWVADFGNPIEWQRNPLNNERWDPDRHWTDSTRDEQRVGDIKLTWEVARFPHAYLIARAAARYPDAANWLAGALASQISGFTAENPWGRGIHWSSGQETAFRLLAWVFAYDTLLSRTQTAGDMARVIADAILAGAAHIEQHLEYARRAIYNNHLLSEAVGLYLAGALFPAVPGGKRWQDLGRSILDEQAVRQFYPDGAYIQQSHNYQRLAMQILLWASLIARARGERPSPCWLHALERSVDFLVAHQNPEDGRLPNYGSNDGALPTPLSSCDFSDFRPTLQAANLLTRGERLYGPGPWDEQAAWMLGPMSLDAPLRSTLGTSVSFAGTGYHVLRGRAPGNYAAFRCGTLRDRFSQIDMLHLDVWWRGLNVLVDAGSYLYNGPPRWHEYFFRTGSHNTVMVDGYDQMMHKRRFKVVYWTNAKLLDFREHAGFALAAGEHYAFRRHPGRCVHRRSVLFVKDDLWVVADTVFGEGVHSARLHWLAGPFPYEARPAQGTLRLDTPHGPFAISVFNAHGTPLPVDVTAGQEDPPRGWLSRYYGEKVPVPSFAAGITGACPITVMSVLGPEKPEVAMAGARWTVAAGAARAEFTLADGMLTPVQP